MEADKALYQQRIMEQMGENERGETANYVVSWKSTAPRRSLDGRRLQKEMPDLYERFLKTGSPSRRFSIRQMHQKEA